MPEWVRRLAFWIAVGLMGGVVTPALLEAINARFPHTGADRLLALAHRGPTSTS